MEGGRGRVERRWREGGRGRVEGKWRVERGWKEGGVEGGAKVESCGGQRMKSEGKNGEW